MHLQNKYIISTSNFNYEQKKMRIALIIVMILAGILLIGSVLLMSPKGWLWLGLGWMSSSGEYGSKKTIEGTLKKVALVASLIFIISALILPYTMGG